MPKISVIVPIYKVEQYLQRCVDSIICQSFESFELILVDDGSPDNCGKICDEYAFNDTRIHVIHKDNGGLSSARNAGIEYTLRNLSVDWICFIDADDYVSPYHLENLAKSALMFPNCYIYGGMVTAEYRSNELVSIVERPPYDRIAVDEKEQFFILQKRGYIGYACNSLFCVEIIKKEKLLFSYDFIIEDLPFVLSYIKHIDSLVYTGYCDYFYRTDERETLSRKYHQETFKKWAEKYNVSMEFIKTSIIKENQAVLLTDISNYYLSLFLLSIENTFDKRNTLKFFHKIEYNKAIIQSDEFITCVQYANTSESNSRYVRMLSKGKYNRARLYRRAVLLFNRRGKGNKI